VKLLSFSGADAIVPIICFLLCTPKTIPPVIWTSIGPGGGGWLSAITILNDADKTIFVGCDVGGIYKSTDHGQTWVVKDKGLSTYYVQDIAYNPKNRNVLYAATRGGVFKSVNGGESWEIKRDHFPAESPYVFSAPVSDIAVDPKTPATVYAAIGITRAGYETDSDHWQHDEVLKGTIFKSTDSGETWSVIHNTGIALSALVYSLAIDPKHTNILFAATDYGMYKSSDFGESWSGVNAGLPHHKAMVVVVNPKTPTTLYVTMWADPENVNWQGGVYKSIDGGDHWVVKNTGLPVPENPGNGYGFTSNFPVLVINPDDPDILYTGNTPWTPDPGVYKTTNGGESWSRVSRPPDGYEANPNVDMGWISEHGVSVKCLAIAPGQPDFLLFGTSTNLFKTVNAGVDWTQAYSRQTAAGSWHGTGLETTCVQDIAVDPTDSGTIYAGYWDMGLLKSTDGGYSFKRLVNGMFKKDVYDYTANTFSIIVDPADHDIIYTAAGWWEENKGTVCTSSDQGENWDCEPAGLPLATVWSIALDANSPANARILYAASYKNGIYKSGDGGRSWIPVNIGLGVGGNLQVRKVLIDPNDSQILYAGIEARHSTENNINHTTHGGLFKSTDAGAHWSRIDNNPRQPSVWDIAVAPGSPGIIYTAASSEWDHSLHKAFYGGVYKSIDGGSRWERVSNGFGPQDNLDVVSVAIHPLRHNILYAATDDAPYHDRSSGRGIFKTTDAGKSWVAVNAGLGILGLNAITIDPSNPSVLYAGSSGNGVFKAVDHEAAR
jgi:photosystem II stability/assembly factor-like uncharacterized protein